MLLESVSFLLTKSRENDLIELISSIKEMRYREVYEWIQRKF